MVTHPHDENLSACTDKNKHPKYADKEPRSGIVPNMQRHTSRKYKDDKASKRYPNEIETNHRPKLQDLKNIKKKSIERLHETYQDKRETCHSFSSLTNSSSHEMFRKKEKNQRRKIQDLERMVRELQESNKKSKKTFRVTPQFAWNVKHVVKNNIYPKVKFVSSEESLEDITQQSSIGYAFLKYYKKLYVQGHEKCLYTDEQIWENAKKILHQTIKQKRCTVQSEIKRAWKGM